MLVTYPDAMTMREARRMYFEANGFGETGGYDDAWVDFKLGPIPMPFPNTKSRIDAVRYHDLHHILTGYPTSFVGELQISAWEIAAGCKGYAAAWVLNLGGMAGGLFRCPRFVLAAFVRGRRDRTLYGETFDPLLDMTVGDARRTFTSNVAASKKGATLADVLLFMLAVTVGIVVALALLAITIPLVPFGLFNHAMRRRAAATQLHRKS